MKKHVMTATLAGASALAGAAAMYYYMVRKNKARVDDLEEQLDDKYKELIEQHEVLKRLNDRLKEEESLLPEAKAEKIRKIKEKETKETKETKFNKSREETTGMADRNVTDEKGTYFIDYAKIKYSDDVRRTLNLPVDSSEKPKFSDTEDPFRGPSHFVISIDEFDRNDEYDKAWLIYYEGDDQLLVEGEHAPMTPSEIATDIRIDFRTMFGQESADEDEVYIRNMVQMTDFQIKRVHSELGYFEGSLYE